MPVATLEATARVSVEAPPVVTLVGLKVPVTPAGAPERDSPMLSALPETRVVLTLVPPEVPWTTETLAGLAAIAKSLGVVVESATVSKVALPSVPHTCEVIARPARTGPLRPTLTLEPGTAVQVVPSGLVEAVHVPPARDSRR